MKSSRRRATLATTCGYRLNSIYDNRQRLYERMVVKKGGYFCFGQVSLPIRRQVIWYEVLRVAV